MTIDLEFPVAAASDRDPSNLDRSAHGHPRPKESAAGPPRAADVVRSIAVLAYLGQRGRELAGDESPARFADELAALKPGNVAALSFSDLIDIAAKAMYGAGSAGLLKGLPSGLLEDLGRRVRDVMRADVIVNRTLPCAPLDILRQLVTLIANARSLGEGFAPHLLPGFDGFGGLPGFQAADLGALGRGPGGRPLPTRELKCALLARLRAVDLQSDLLRAALVSPSMTALERNAIENELAAFVALKSRLGEVLVQAVRSEHASNEAILRRLEL